MSVSMDRYRLRRAGGSADRESCLRFYRKLSSTVSIVSAMSDDLGPLGLTVSSVSSLSLEPPLLLVCLAHHSKTLQAALDNGRFAVHVLQSHQHELATEFATLNTHRFRKHGFALIANVPILTEVGTWSICDLVDIRAYGDRSLLVGQVIATGDGAMAEPLVWHDSNYLTVSSGKSHEMAR
jgi:flavin reductase (DIM6/NTAB) family NADH-FMN oxidoreductase RutF